MKMASFTSLALCVVLAVTMAEAKGRSTTRIMIVTIPRQEVTTDVGSTVRLPCSWSIGPAQSGRRPTINWYKGDDGISTATMIFSTAQAPNPTGYGDYQYRVSLDNPADATLTLRAAQLTDEGRYWCAVFDSDQHTELGMDSKSILLKVTDPNQQDVGTLQDPLGGRPGYLVLDVPTQRQVWQGEDVVLPCLCNGCSSLSTKTWFTVSFDDTWAAQEQVIATERPCQSHQCHGGTTTVEEGFQDRFSVNLYGLKIAGTKRQDTRRYWCQVEDLTYTRGSGVDAKSVALAIESRCTGKPDGIYQHPDDCAKFYTCGGGLQYDGINTCPSGLLFDQTLGYCDWAHTVTCL